jgi:MFS transporter, DHA1 family, multidrug resistance protein
LQNRNEAKLLSVLGFFMMTAPASTDMYLPALVQVSRDLGVTQGETQLTLSYFFLGFAVGQLLWGSLSDRYGRRRPMMVGIAMYIAGSAGSALAGDIAHLHLWRFVQAFGGCAMPVIAQAMARDIYGREGSARALSIMLLIMALAPALAPLFGAQVLRFAGWRDIFWVLGAFGVIAMAGAIRMPESLPPARRNVIGWGNLAHSYAILLRDPRFLAYALSGAAVSGASFAYITGTAFVHIGYFGLSSNVFGLLFGLNIAGMTAMTLVNSRIVTGKGFDNMLRIGFTGCALFSVLLALASLDGVAGLGPVVVLLFCFMSMRGMVAANVVAGALSNHPQRTGAASALHGCMQFGTGYLVGIVLKWLHDGTPRPMAIIMAVCAVLGLFIFFVMHERRRTRRVREA